MTYGHHKLLTTMLGSVIFDSEKHYKSYGGCYPKCFNPISIETISFFFALVCITFTCRLYTQYFSSGQALYSGVEYWSLGSEELHRE
jgi:hypothetical protein